MVVIFGRMVCKGLSFLLLAAMFSSVPLKQKNFFSDIKLVIIMAVCEPCLYFIFEAKAIELTTVSQVGMICAIMPLLVSVVAFLS